MAVVVGCALLAGGFGEQESAPVCDAADDTASGENLVAGCAGDSGGSVLGVCEGGGGDRVGLGVLFDLVDTTAGTDLGDCVSLVFSRERVLQHTTPISSYNMADMWCWVFVCAGCCSPGDVERLAALRWI